MTSYINSTAQHKDMDMELIQLIIHSPEEGLQMLIDKRFRITLNSLHSYGIWLHPYQQDDLCAQLLEVVWKNAHRYAADRGSLNSWLLGIAIRISRSQYRASFDACIEYEYMNELADTQPTSRSVTAEMRIDATRDAISHLPHRQSILAELDTASASGIADTKDAMVAVDADTPGAVHSLRKRYLQNLSKPHRHQRLHSLMKRIKK